MNERRSQYGADLLERSRERALGCQHRPTMLSTRSLSDGSRTLSAAVWPAIAPTSARVSSVERLGNSGENPSRMKQSAQPDRRRPLPR